MDYPAPLVTIDDSGALDFSDAYGVGVGKWDKHAIRWAYSQFPPSVDEAEELDRIVRGGIDRGLFIVSDADARPAGALAPTMAMLPPGNFLVSMVLSLSRLRASLTRPRSDGVSRSMGASRSLLNIFIDVSVGETCKIGDGSLSMT